VAYRLPVDTEAEARVALKRFKRDRLPQFIRERQGDAVRCLMSGQ